MPQFVTSKDGTGIAFDTVGDGTPVILVLGALNTGKSGAKLAKLLASKFTVVSYDRRGRGKSADTAPYSPPRETEDIAGLVAEVGGPVCLYGHSSGAARRHRGDDETAQGRQDVSHLRSAVRPRRRR